MLKKCPTCSRVFHLPQGSLSCPGCGADFATTAPVVAVGRPEPEGGGIIFPQRTSPSLEDDIRDAVEEVGEKKELGEVRMLALWTDRLESRPLDVPFYTALNGRGCVLVHFSTDSVAGEGTIAEVVAARRPWAMYLATFTGGNYPVLRSTLAFPDNPLDPYVMESPLDISEGNVQAFCRCALENPYLDVILKHESVTGQYVAVSYHAPRLAERLREQLAVATAHYVPGLTTTDFREGVSKMEAAYPSALDGHDRSQQIQMLFAGDAKNRFIQT